MLEPGVSRGPEESERTTTGLELVECGEDFRTEGGAKRGILASGLLLSASARINPAACLDSPSSVTEGWDQSDLANYPAGESLSPI